MQYASRRYVNEADLQLFKDKIEKEDQPSDVGLWELMMDKDYGNFTYAAWRRKLPVWIAFKAYTLSFIFKDLAAQHCHCSLWQGKASHLGRACKMASIPVY